jgi:hypothetical protein
VKYLAILALVVSMGAQAQAVGGNSGVGHGMRAATTNGANGVGAIGGNAGAVGAAMGNGGQWSWNGYMTQYDPNSVDRFQPWPESQMRQYQEK